MNFNKITIYEEKFKDFHLKIWRYKYFFVIFAAQKGGYPLLSTRKIIENETMKERIRQIQEREEMTQKEFAAAIGISQASLSSIYNGHTLPTNRHVEAIHKRFPEINTNWLMFAEGEMIVNGASAAETSQRGNNLTDESVRPQVVEDGDLFSPSFPADSLPAVETSPNPKVSVQPIIKYVDKPKRRVREIQVIYDDDFFETFVPKSEK